MAKTKVMTDEELLVWFNEVIEEQKKFYKLCMKIPYSICTGNMENTVQFGSTDYKLFNRIATLLHKRPKRFLSQYRTEQDENAEYRFSYKGMVICCLINNPDYRKEEKVND